MKESTIFHTPPPPPPSPDVPVATIVAKIVANVADYRRTLPSITADEAIASDLAPPGDDPAHSIAQATIRVYPGEEGKQLNESRTYLSINGVPVAPGRKATIPFQLNGAFSRVSEAFFTAQHAACFTFTILPDPGPDSTTQLTFTNSAEPPAGCFSEDVTVAGLVRIDPATDQIRHVERTITSAALDTKNSVTYLAVDFAPATIGTQTFWLPTLITAELDHGKGHFTARYSNYHRYTSTVKILPNTP